MAFVPEGQADSSQVRSAWVVMQKGPRPGGTVEVIVSPEWQEDKEDLGRFIAPEGLEEVRSHDKGNTLSQYLGDTPGLDLAWGASEKR